MATTRRFGLLSAAVFLFALAALGGVPPAAADSTLTEQCQVCHGPDGVSRWPDIPNISGLPEVVLANAMYDFRGRARPCRLPACGQDGSCPDVDMCTLSVGLTEAEIDRYARYYSAQPFSPSVADVDPELVTRGLELHDRYCEKCHTAGGSNPLDEASILRGQNMEYMRNAMADYRERRREQEAPMAKAIDSLDDEDVEALLHFYASPTR